MGIFRIRILRRIQITQNFSNPPTQIFWNAFSLKCVGKNIISTSNSTSAQNCASNQPPCFMHTNLTQIDDPWTSVDMVLPVIMSHSHMIINLLFESFGMQWDFSFHRNHQQKFLISFSLRNVRKFVPRMTVHFSIFRESHEYWNWFEYWWILHFSTIDQLVSLRVVHLKNKSVIWNNSNVRSFGTIRIEIR